MIDFNDRTGPPSLPFGRLRLGKFSGWPQRVVVGLSSCTVTTVQGLEWMKMSTDESKLIKVKFVKSNCRLIGSGLREDF
jgi:hypothetical protein